jgi:hypothetical protein
MDGCAGKPQQYVKVSLQKKMEYRIRLCHCGCGKMATDKHHKYSKTRKSKELYPEYIDHPDNLLFYANEHHLNKTIKKWNELQFCRFFGIIPRSKDGLFTWNRLSEEDRWPLREKFTLKMAGKA